jgi:hypothetical protein
VSEAKEEIAEQIAKRLRWQGDWCERLGSPLYAAILEDAAADVERGGPALELLRGNADEPGRTFLALRLLGAVHRLVLTGRIPELAELYPSTGGSGDLALAPARFVEALGAHAGEVRAEIGRPVQTNEVGRCTALLGAFLTVARETGLPLALREVGASAGLHLRFDRYRYTSDGWSWGDPESAVRFTGVFESGVPPAAPIEVAERHGCDRAPLDPRSEEDRLTLMSFTWPDQTARFGVLRDALEIASGDDVFVEQAGAAEWTERMLAEPQPGHATVLFHSIVIAYLSGEEAERMHRAILAAGSRASADAPLAWLYLEPGEELAEVRLVLWPGGEERLLARSGFHGGPVRWLAG